jgi:hypothetical protein
MPERMIANGMTERGAGGVRSNELLGCASHWQADTFPPYSYDLIDPMFVEAIEQFVDASI